MNYIVGNTICNRQQIKLKQNLWYAAGSIVIQYSFLSQSQIKYLIGSFQVNAILISQDGSKIITGEQCFKNPAINIFILDNQKEQLQQYPNQQLFGHKFGIKKLIESPSQPYLVSLGNEKDKMLNVWNMSNNKMLSSNKLANIVNSIEFNNNGQILISAGQSHLKYWTFSNNDQINEEDEHLLPKNFHLPSNFISKNFIEIQIINEELISLTQDSQLCLLSLKSHHLLKWVNLISQYEANFTIYNNIIYTCQQQEQIQLFDTQLNYIRSIKLNQNQIISNNQDYKIISIEIYQNILVIINSKQTISIYNILNIKQPILLNQLSSIIQPIENIITLKNQSCKEVTFYACATQDQNIIIWNSGSKLNSIKQFNQCSNLSQIISTNSYYVKCLIDSPNGQYLIAGCRDGSVLIYELENFSIKKIINDHHDKITSLQFCQINQNFATGSEDSFIFIYNKNFEKIAFINDHLSQIIQIEFLEDKLISCSFDKFLIFREYHNQHYSICNKIQSQQIYTIKTFKNYLLTGTEKKLVMFQNDQIISEHNSGFPFEIKIAETYKGLLILLRSTQQIEFYQFSNQNKLQLYRTLDHLNCTTFDISIDTQLLITGRKNGCLILWNLDDELQDSQNTIQNIIKFKEKSKFLINNLWDEKLLQEEIENNKQFETIDDQTILTTNQKYKQTIDKLIFNQFMNFENSVKQQDELQNYLIHKNNTIETNKSMQSSLLHNSYYEEYQRMQQFHKKQSSYIKTRQLEILKQKQQQVQFQDVNENSIVIPNQSIMMKQQQQDPIFPKLEIFNLQNIEDNSFSYRTNNQNYQSQKESIVLNCSYKADNIQDETQVQSIMNAKKCIRNMLQQFDKFIQQIKQQQIVDYDIQNDLQQLELDIQNLNEKKILNIEEQNLKQLVQNKCCEIFQDYVHNLVTQKKQ